MIRLFVKLFLLFNLALPVYADIFYTPSGQGDGVARMSASLNRIVMSQSSGFSCAGEFEICLVQAKATNSRASNNLYSNSGGALSDSLKSNVVGHNGFVYWVSNAGQIIRDSINSGIREESISSMQVPSRPTQITADDDFVYWAEAYSSRLRIYRAANDGSGNRQLMAQMATVIDVVPSLQVDDQGNVYFLFMPDLLLGGNKLYKVSANNSGGFTVTQGSQWYIQNFKIHGSEVFIAHHRSIFNSIFSVTLKEVNFKKASTSNLSSWTTIHALSETGNPQVHEMTVSESFVFWHEKRNNVGSSILRISKTGGAPRAITQIINSPWDLLIASDDEQEHLYWIQDRGVQRVQVDVTSLSQRDLLANVIRLEVTQALQNAAHDIPLITGKRTVVRAFPSLANSPGGPSSLDLWPAIVLYGERNGIALPDSPLRPREFKNVTTAPVSRDSENNQFTFELPESWLLGTVTLTATVDPQNLILESNETNNSSSRTVVFEEVDAVCIDIIPVLTATEGTQSGGSRSEKEQTFARARTLLPVNNFSYVFRGGNPKTKPWTGDPYDFTHSEDPAELLFHWSVDFMFSSPPPHCGGARTVIRTAIVHDARRFGIASPVSPIMLYLQRFNNFTPAENHPIGGVSGLAHETGHILGQHHIGCPVSGPGAPAFPDGNYPYNVCSIEDNNSNHIGYDVISSTLIRPFNPSIPPISNYSDYMSYQNNYWVSDYVYRRQFNQLRSASAAPLSPADIVVTGESLIIGGIKHQDKPFQMGHGYQLDSTSASEVWNKLSQWTEVSEDYKVLLYDNANNLLHSELIRTVPIEDNDSDFLAFFVMVPNYNNLSRLEVVDVNKNVVFNQSYGVRTPSVVFNSPSGGGVLPDHVEMSWTGHDPDGDTLEYRLFYSTDDGGSWFDILTTRSSSAMVDLTEMPTGAFVFKILVSDGLHSSESFIGPFSRPNVSPTVAIMNADYEETSGTFNYNFGESILLHGYAYDSDDGHLDGNDLSWSVTGPEGRSGQGKNLTLNNLQPGNYSVVFNATDKEGATSSSTKILVVRPKKVASASNMKLDGLCNDQGYISDKEVILLKYPGSPEEFVELRMVYENNYVYACFNGLAYHNEKDTVELRFDNDLNTGNASSSQNPFVEVSYLGGVRTGLMDNSGNAISDQNAQNVFAAISVNPKTLRWRAELRMDRSFFNGWNKTIAMQASHFSGESHLSSWPMSSTVAPQTWGLVDLGSPLLSHVRFSKIDRYWAGEKPVSLLVDHFNTDDSIDIASINAIDKELYVLPGFGNGDFNNQAIAPFQVIPPVPSSGSRLKHFAAGDINKDGLIDFAVLDDGASYVKLLFNDGNGGYLDEDKNRDNLYLPRGANKGATELALADLNNDSLLDLVVITELSGKVVILWGLENGRFEYPVTELVADLPSMLQVFDLNLDGYLDLITASTINESISIFTNDRLGGFSKLTIPANDVPADLLISDLNYDHRPDIVLLLENQTISILYQDSQGGYTLPWQEILTSDADQAQTFAIDDINQDGLRDVITGNKEGSISLLFGNLQGGFSKPVDYFIGQNIRDISLADLDHNQTLDLVAIDETANQILVLLNKGVVTDSDGDGLSDKAEQYIGSNIYLADTDNDGLTDGKEFNLFFTSITESDTDGDGLNDGNEVFKIGSHPNNADTDGDGNSDAEEVFAGSNPNDPNSNLNTLVPVQGAIKLKAGLNMVAATLNPNLVPDLATWVESVLGGEGIVEGVSKMSPATGKLEHCNYVVGKLQGMACYQPLKPGEGVLIYTVSDEIIDIDITMECSQPEFLAGLNLVSFPCLSSAQTAFEFLETRIATDGVVTITAFNTTTGRWSTTTIDEKGKTRGENFLIQPLSAYFMFISNEELP